MLVERSLSQVEARKAIEAMRLACEQRALAAVLAVADRSGELVALLRLDHARLAAVQIAANKAYCAARERTASRNIGIAARDPKSGFEMAYFGDPRFTGWGGGLPVHLEGECVGAVAVSGLTSELDEEIAAIGVAAIVGTGQGPR